MSFLTLSNPFVVDGHVTRGFVAKGLLSNFVSFVEFKLCTVVKMWPNFRAGFVEAFGGVPDLLKFTYARTFNPYLSLVPIPKGLDMKQSLWQHIPRTT
jgi:hypothetical protein